jgi:hypothetical protein
VFEADELSKDARLRGGRLKQPDCMNLAERVAGRAALPCSPKAGARAMAKESRSGRAKFCSAQKPGRPQWGARQGWAAGGPASLRPPTPKIEARQVRGGGRRCGCTAAAGISTAAARQPRRAGCGRRTCIEREEGGPLALGHGGDPILFLESQPRASERKPLRGAGRAGMEGGSKH